MSTLTVKKEALTLDVYFTDSAVHLVLADGREVSAPLEWFPRLRNATSEQRKHWRLVGKGVCVHWPDVDEDIETESLLGI